MEKKELDAIVKHYEGYDEETRFDARWCWVEYYTTMQYIHRYLHPGDRLLEIGAGTGRYSITLAQEGNDVTAVELVERNLDALRAKITPGMRIRAMQGNALDLSMLESESYDMTLLFGPTYHLISEADKRQAISEALRVTKPGGILMVAYCITDGPMINYTFRLGKYDFLTECGMLDPETWKFHPERGFIFEHITKADVDRLVEGFPVKRLHYVATDGLLSFLQTELETMDDETLKALLRYHLSVCEREDLVGATAHSLDIVRKTAGTTEINALPLKCLQPSQFYISEKKLKAIESWFDPSDLSGFEPIPIKLLDGIPVMTDGHTRAVAALRAGLDTVPLVWDEDDLDWEMYQVCVTACHERKVYSPVDLLTQIMSETEYQAKWEHWRHKMQAEIIQNRMAKD